MGDEPVTSFKDAQLSLRVGFRLVPITPQEHEATHRLLLARNAADLIPVLGIITGAQTPPTD